MSKFISVSHPDSHWYLMLDPPPCTDSRSSSGNEQDTPATRTGSSAWPPFWEAGGIIRIVHIMNALLRSNTNGWWKDRDIIVMWLWPECFTHCIRLWSGACVWLLGSQVMWSHEPDGRVCCVFYCFIWKNLEQAVLTFLSEQLTHAVMYQISPRFK